MSITGATPSLSFCEDGQLFAPPPKIPRICSKTPIAPFYKEMPIPELSTYLSSPASFGLELLLKRKAKKEEESEMKEKKQKKLQNVLSQEMKISERDGGMTSKEELVSILGGKYEVEDKQDDPLESQSKINQLENEIKILRKRQSNLRQKLLMKSRSYDIKGKNKNLQKKRNKKMSYEEIIHLLYETKKEKEKLKATFDEEALTTLHFAEYVVPLDLNETEEEARNEYSKLVNQMGLKAKKGIVLDSDYYLRKWMLLEAERVHLLRIKEKEQKDIAITKTLRGKNMLENEKNVILGKNVQDKMKEAMIALTPSVASAKEAEINHTPFSSLPSSRTNTGVLVEMVDEAQKANSSCDATESDLETGMSEAFSNPLSSRSKQTTRPTSSSCSSSYPSLATSYSASASSSSSSATTTTSTSSSTSSQPPSFNPVEDNDALEAAMKHQKDQIRDPFVLIVNPQPITNSDLLDNPSSAAAVVPNPSVHVASSKKIDIKANEHPQGKGDAKTIDKRTIRKLNRKVDSFSFYIVPPTPAEQQKRGASNTKIEKEGKDEGEKTSVEKIKGIKGSGAK
eukprot:MONOS_1663.1-p1 / transcript=MONOS_1663.1 / gene=MONOS_1663 / organism=Monocercomonoides_exilis_PA203 / gene_product=unspecified product / transcript_product=unspecified product / location=Mono_scaffold00030:179712-181484(-) / protein_length=568 / sequence_SO=supercontig / SO=protein_coding / is_pseudo=false